MTEEPTMPTAVVATQRVYAKKLAADRESEKRKRVEESKEQQENRLAADRESNNRKRAEELPEHVKPDLLLKEKVKKEGLPRNHKNSKKTG